MTIWTTSRDLCAILRVPRGTLHRWASEDAWPRIVVGGVVVYQHERAIETYERKRPAAAR